MNVDAEPRIISEIPTWIIRVFVNYDRVGVPEPIGNVRNVHGGYAPVPVVKPKSVRTAACQAPFVAATETAGEMAVLPRMGQMKTRIMGFMAYPMARPGVYVRRVRMPGPVADVGMLRGSRWTALVRSRLTMRSCLRCGTARSGCAVRSTRRAMRGDIAMAHTGCCGGMALFGVFLSVPSGMFFTMLAKRHLGLKKERNSGTQQQYCRKFGGSGHKLS